MDCLTTLGPGTWRIVSTMTAAWSQDQSPPTDVKVQSWLEADLKRM